MFFHSNMTLSKNHTNAIIDEMAILPGVRGKKKKRNNKERGEKLIFQVNIIITPNTGFTCWVVCKPAQTSKEIETRRAPNAIGCSQMYRGRFIKFSVRGKVRVKIFSGTEELRCLKNAGF